MRELLFDVLFKSDIRKDLLLLLKGGPRDTEEIMRSIDIERQPLSIQMKMLEDKYLVREDMGRKGSYMLTTIGKLLVEEMGPLLGILDFLDANNGYWEDHRLDFIPHDLLERIAELSPCTISEPRFSEMYEFSGKFQERSESSSSLLTITTCLHPMFISFLLDLLSRDVAIYMVFSRDLFEKIRSEQYSNLRLLVENKQANLYIYPGDMHFISFMENDHYLQFMLLTNENCYDNKRFMSESPDALRWGRDFFEHYKNESLPVTEI